jgi:Carboxypeptidase regulatory-like domain
MQGGKVWRGWFAAAVALGLALAAPVAAQLQYGDLFGTVHSDKGEALPGVTVTLSGSQAPRIAVTDDSGQFRFLNLSPGIYGLRAELQGFSTVEYPDVAVRVGGRAEIEVTLQAAIEETITVTGQSPLLDERQQNRGTFVSVGELDKLPTARDPWSLLNQAPGVVVDRVNVGGNESGQQSNFLGVGSLGSENTFAVDGVILTDMAAVGGSATYFDFGAFDEVQFTVSSTDVSVATAGVTINQVTKRGTNAWRGSARYLDTDGSLQASPSLPDGNRIKSVEEYGADVGGPLWKDHLWGWASYGKSDIQNLVLGGQLDRTQLEDYNYKLNFQATPANSGVVHYWTNDKLKDGRGAGSDRSPETTLDQTTPQDIWKAEDTHIASSNFFVTGLWSRDDGIFTLTPKGGDNADVYQDGDGVWHGSYWDFAQGSVLEQWRLDASYFFNTGGVSQELKFGGGYRHQDNTSDTVWPRGKVVVSCQAYGCGAEDPSIQIAQLWRNKSLAVKSTYTSGWVQDTLTKERWTITAGLRYDLQKVENQAASDSGNPLVPDLIPPLNFPGNDAGGFDWKTISPRVGVTYNLGEGHKTLLRGTFSRYAEQLGQQLAQRVNPIGYSYAAFYFTDANSNLVLDDSELGSLEFYYAYNFDPDNPTALATTNVTDPNLGPTLYDEVTLGTEHAFTPQFAVGATLTYRKVHDIPEARLLVFDEALGAVRQVNRDDYVLDRVVTCPSDACSALPDGSTGSGAVYELRDGIDSTGGRFYTTGDRKQDYYGITLTATKRLANRWQLRGHFTYSDWKWHMGPDFLAHDDPTNTIFDSGELAYADGNDVVAQRSAGSGNKKDVWTGANWSFNVSGLYQIAPEKPWSFNVAASLTGRQGFPTPPYVPVGSGRQLQLTSDFDHFRNPDIFLLDARIDKDFQFGDFKFTLSIDGFNLTNQNYVLQRERGLNLGTANVIREELSPRVFRVGARLDFR